MLVHDRLRKALAAMQADKRTAIDESNAAWERGYQAGLANALWAVGVDERVYVRAARVSDEAESESERAYGR